MLIYGKQPVYYILQHHPELVTTLYLAKDVEKREYSKLMKFDFELKRIPSEAADKMCKSSNHQGFLCEIGDISFASLKSFLNKDFVIILSSITDVGNIGAIVRSAYALGVEGIIVTGVKQLKLEPIVRSSTGALLDMPLVLCHNIYDVINDLKMSGFTLYGATMDGEDIRDVEVAPKKALVLGSESTGLTDRMVAKLDKKISIAMEHGFDSLNVSVAGAILMDRMRG
jgi:23S rRNA (guanosine2251-2'-O)-methyltransferase